MPTARSAACRRLFPTSQASSARSRIPVSYTHLLDEPTNNLDIEAINWLENFILDYEDTGLVIVVSHDRHFLNTVCTHIVDIDYGKIKMYVGNYDFWYESSQLVQQLIRNKNKRNEEKIAELQTFISRFAANKAKSKQATSRRRLLDKLSVEEVPASSRRYPFAVSYTHLAFS